MNILDQISNPEDLKKLPLNALPQLVEAIKAWFEKEAPGKDSHRNASLGVTALTVALHYALETPKDVLIWDVGHQAYVHKFLTGRKNRMKSMRKKGGISGFTSREESDFDPFSAGHSSTSISALAGFAASARLRRIVRNHVAVIGDGALTGGMAFEALNHLGQTQEDVLIILNDNELSLDANVGGLAKSKNYHRFFESLGFRYYALSPEEIDVLEIVDTLETVLPIHGPKILHLKTEKEKAVAQKGEKWQDLVGEKLIELATEDDRVVVVTPAMTTGSGLNEFAEKFPDRFFDVGIAEQHAVTFSAGLAASGMKPYCVLYSTFAQRAYDQIIHDVAAQNLPVTFLIDRAGFVGEDGVTHQGLFDMAFLMPIPQLEIFSPSSADRFSEILKQSLQKETPVVIRYPKGEVALKNTPEILNNSEVAVLAVGSAFEECYKAFKQQPGLFSLYPLEQIKPLSQDLLNTVFEKHSKILIVEEGSKNGGVGQLILASFNDNHPPKGKIKIAAVEDQFVPHASVEEQRKSARLDAERIIDTINNWA